MVPVRVRLPLALLAAGLVAACDGDGTGPGREAGYRVTPLGAMVGATGQLEPFVPSALNDAGEVAGSTPSGAIGVWRDGAVVSLARTGMVQDLNEAGSLVGRDLTLGAFLASAGEVRAIAGTGAQSFATGVNEQGRVVGYGIQAGGVRAFYWNGTSVTVLDHPTFPTTFAVAVNDADQVAGAGQRELCSPVPAGFVCATVLRAVVWKDGQRTQLPLFDWFVPEPGGPQVRLAELDGQQAADINNAGEVVGTAFVHVCLEDRTGCRSRSRGFLWRGSEMVNLGRLDGLESTQALAVNDLGQVVGFGWSWTTSARRPFLWENGRLRDLSRAATHAGWQLEVALGINGRGQIVGYGLDTATGERGGVLLTPAR